MTVDELQVLITANTNELRKEIGNANKNISSLQKSANKGTAGVTSAFKKLKTGIIALGIGKVIKDSISSGMDAIESDSLFETSLGASADAVRSWSDDVSNTLGLSAVSMRKNTGVIYNMTSSMGVAEDNALKMSKGISLLSEDMASFYNLDSKEAFNKLRAGLTGETEPLKALGILVDENTIKQVAYSEGIAEVGSELTQQQKVMARYVAILKQTGNAQGDLARTIDSPANQLRQLKQQVTNLGIAFSNFLMPIVSAVLPYLTAFAKVVTQALNGLSSFLGLSGTNASDETKKISENVGGLASGYDDATKSAKKLKGSLAGFDEMNTISENTSDSGSASSGASTTVGVDFDLSEYDAHLDWVDSKTDKLVEKIKGYFSSIGEGIDFSKLTTAFNNLKTSIEPLAANIWDGLKWAYDNVLKPLAQWTINDVIPNFLDIFSGGIDIVNQAIEDIKPIFQWFWDSVLSPIAEWTGGVIVSVLEGIADALKWIADNEIAMSILEGLAFAIGLVSAATTVWNWVTGVATPLTASLGAAFNFLTSPITLVTLAIAAVIAIVLLCIKHWDEIKEAASKCWDGIVNVWNIVADWFSENVIEPIKNFFTGLWDGIKNIFKTVVDWIKDNWKALLLILVNPFAGAFKLIYDNCEGFRKIVDNVCKAIKDFFAGLWTGIKNIFSSVGTWFKDVFTGAWEGIKTAFSKVTGFFKGIWDSIKEIFGKVGSAIADAIGGTVKKAINTVLSMAVKIINGFISAINLAIKLINMIPGVEIDELKKLEVPKLARGGITTGSTLANIGEAGREAVLPLENNLGYLDKFAEKIASKIDGGVGNFKLIVKLGEEAIFDKFIEYGKAKSFETNGEVVFG